MSDDFVDDAIHNQIAGKLADAFFRHYRYRPSDSEVRSWQNSLRAMSQILQAADLDDHGVILEYQLPQTSRRLDCMICGVGADDTDGAVIVELKQWDECSDVVGDDLVSTWVGGAHREVLHPSAQVRQYHLYLQDTHTAFHDGAAPVTLRSCAYLHNYSREPEDVLFSSKFAELTTGHPAFTADDVDALCRFLAKELAGGRGEPVLQRIERSRYRPSKKLMEHVSDVIGGLPQYVLLDEQLVVFEKVRAMARAGLRDRRKAVVLVRGGPGTGKSVIAMNLVADLSREGRNAHYATGSRAFTETLRKIIGTRGSAQFKYFNSYQEAAPNDVDVLICDEAHRLRAASWNRFTPKAKRADRAQLQELIDVAKVSVFFIDDKQVVRPGEVGSSAYIRELAATNDCTLHEHQLEAQFRCAGSEGFVNWVETTLGIERTANVLWDPDDEFDFKIYGSPEELDRAIRGRAEAGFSARMTAGFCWPWSKPKKDGTLEDDVVIGSFRRPWNAKPDAGKLAHGIPKSNLWAHDPEGLDQIGCVYTAQGFEFDYVGVIFGPDLTYDFESQAWLGDPAQSHDTIVKRAKDDFVDLARHVYRVLVSRGLKGCYVHFMDADAEHFVRSRIERNEAVTGTVPAPAEIPAGVLPFRRLDPQEVRPFRNAVPVYDLETAAGMSSGRHTAGGGLHGREDAAPSEFDWVELEASIAPDRGLFVARVAGESMNRRIPNGAWCLFRYDPVGTRNGKVVLAQHRSIEDPETGGSYTVKAYESEKIVAEGDTARHSPIYLSPDSTDAEFEVIELNADNAGELRIAAELVAVLV